MTRIVIAGSAAPQSTISEWLRYWSQLVGYTVLDYPKEITQNRFDEIYPEVHKNCYNNIRQADVLFIANEKKNGIEGYIGAETFAELASGLAQKLVYGKSIRLVLANMPTREVSSYNEIVVWTRLGWVELMKR